MCPKRILKKYFCKIKITFQTLQTDIFWTLSWPFSCDYSFWLRDLKFSMYIKDSIEKTCWKNGKDLSDGASKIKLWNHAKKTHFPSFCESKPGCRRGQPERQQNDILCILLQDVTMSCQGPPLLQEDEYDGGAGDKNGQDGHNGQVQEIQELHNCLL